MGLISPAHNKPWLGVPINWGDPLARGLVGCWLMNEGTGDKVYDLSGNGKTGSFVGSTGFKSARFGSGVEFDGTDSVINLGTIHNFTTQPFTYSCWVNFDTLQAGTNPTILWKGNWEDCGYYWCVNKVSNPTQALVFFTNNQLLTPKVVSTATASNIIQVGQWYFLVVTRDGTSVRLYVNGVDKTDTAGSHIDPGTASGKSLICGAYESTYSNIDGKFDHLMCYNRALSATEVQQLYMAPFRMFERPSIEFYSVFAGAADLDIYAYDTE
jgi:hypothetical protein